MEAELELSMVCLLLSSSQRQETVPCLRSLKDFKPKSPSFPVHHLVLVVVAVELFMTVGTDPS